MDESEGVVITDFRINVILDPSGASRGAREVERELTRVEASANKAQTALRRAFTGVTLGLVVREIVRYADSLTDLQNRLRLLVPEQTALVKRTHDLLDVANDTRTALEGTVILYQRLGLATRELGIENSDLLGIVKSINQALILSGASAKEANNGLIQLSQGIASNRLGGDELRSTLEQLPAVADVIARQLGVTRGQLREMGAEGTITGEVIIEAFKNAKDVLEEQFGSTIPTLSQSLVVLRNNLIVFFGELNQGTGTLAALGSIIRFIGNNVQALARTLGVAAAAFVALKLAPTIQAFFQLQAAVKAGNAVILGSGEAARQKANFDRAQAVAAAEAAAAEVRKTQALIASTAAERSRAVVSANGTAQAVAAAQAELALVAATHQQTVATIQNSIATQRANLANIATRKGVNQVFGDGVVQLIAIEELEEQLTVQTAALAGAQTRLAASQAAANQQAAIANALGQQDRAIKAQLTAQTNALAAANTRVATTSAFAATQANVFTRTLESVKQGISGIFTLILRNPLGSLVVTLTSGAAALFLFRDRIKASSDGIATLGDVFTETIDQVKGGTIAAASLLDERFGGAFKKIGEFFSNLTVSFKGIVLGITKSIDTVLGVVVAIVGSVFETLVNLPGAIAETFIGALNLVPRFFELIFDAVTAGFNTIKRVASDVSFFVLNFFRELGTAAQLAASGQVSAAFDIVKQASSQLASGLIGTAKNVPTIIGEEFEKASKTDLIPRIANSFEGASATLGARVASAFSEGLKVTDITDFAKGVFAGAEENAQARETGAAQAEANKAREEAARLAALQTEAFNGVVGKLREEQQVLQATLAGDKAAGDAKRAIIDLNNKLAEQKLPALSSEQEAELTAIVRRNDQLTKYLQLQQEIIPVEQEFLDKRTLISQAYAEGAINFEQYTEALRKLRLEEAEVGTSVSDGLVTGFDKVKTQMMDVAAVAETALVNAFNSAEDALVEFVTTGQVDMKKFALSIIGDIARIIARLLILQAIQAITGTAPAAAATGSLQASRSLASSQGGMPPLAAEGSTMAMANKPFIVGENGPELFTPGQTGSITPTDQTIGALAKASSGQGGTTVVQAPAPAVNLSVVNVTDPKEALTALNSPEGEQMILNILQKNPETVRRLQQ